MMPSRTFTAREKSMPCSKASKDRWTLLLAANEAGDLHLKPMLNYHGENAGAVKNQAKPTLPLLYKWNNNVWVTAHLFTMGD